MAYKSKLYEYRIVKITLGDGDVVYGIERLSEDFSYSMAESDIIGSVAHKIVRRVLIDQFFSKLWVAVEQAKLLCKVDDAEQVEYID